MKVVKALLLEENKENIRFFRELFSKWDVDLQVVQDVENSLIRIHIFKPNIILISSDLDIDYEHTLSFLFNRNYPIISYGNKKLPDKWKRFTTFLGFFPTPIHIFDFKKSFFSPFKDRNVSNIQSDAHIEIIINDKVGVVELEGELDWEQSHEIKYKLIRFLSEEVVVGVIFIFHALENPDRDLEEVIPHLFGFLQDINISPKHIKYLTMDERIKALLKRDSLLRRIEEVSSYAEAFMKIQSLTFNKSNIGLDIDFIKEDTKLVENVYDETGNLIKKAGEVFTTEDIEKLRRDAIQKIYYARELSGLGVQVNNLPNFKENIEQIIMNQAESAEEEAILPEDKDAASKMVLIIEDDSASQKILSKVMNKMGYQFKICSNGNEGLKTAIQFNPNLIILDLMMPGMNGVQFIQSYKDVRKKGQAPILVLSAVNRMDIIQSVVKMGVKDYILKPVNLKMLVEKVHNNII